MGVPAQRVAMPCYMMAPHLEARRDGEPLQRAVKHPNHPNPMTDFPTLSWPDTDGPRTVRWRSEAGVPAPKRVVVADDRTTADAAYRLACEGTALLWRGDYQNARQLLQAMARRAERKPRKAAPPKAP